MTKRNANNNHNVFEEVNDNFGEAKTSFEQWADEVQMKLSGMDRVKWDKYCNNVEKTFELVGEKITKSYSRFKDEASKGNYDLAAKNFGRTLKACMKGLQVAMVDIAESLGITRILRGLKIVKNDPNKIMQNLRTQIVKIEPKLSEDAKSKVRDLKKVAKKMTKGVNEKMADLRAR